MGGVRGLLNIHVEGVGGRMGRVRLLTVVLAVALTVCLVPASASAATVVNGGFETGDFTGWQEQDQTGGSGSWYVYTGTSSPLSHHMIPAPPEGSDAASTDSTGDGSHILYQDVALEPGLTHTLSLYVYYNSYAAIASPSSLDKTTSPNQQYRIDVMKPGASLTSVDPADILLTVFRTQTGDPTSLAPTLMTVDLTPFAGQTVRLRAAEVDNQLFFNAGLDAVTITSAPPTIAPAVATLPATGVTTGGATLNGSVNPNGFATSYHFEYGTTTAYGIGVPLPDAGVGSDNTDHSLTQAISGLQPGTTYHFRVVATNANGTSYGADQTFTTPLTPPPTTTSAVLAIVYSASESHHTWRDSTTRRRARISRALAPVGTTFKFTLNKAAPVRFVFKQLLPGRRVARGRLSFSGHAGANKVRFFGWLSKTRKLKPGKYMLVLTATTPGVGSSSKILKFRIVR